MIMVRYRTEKDAQPVSRTRTEAERLAKGLIEEISSGTKMETLLKYTDDVGEDGRPYNDGSYSFDPRSGAVQAKLLEFIRGIEPGKLAPTPYDSGYGFHVIRRDR
jgi:hypothetical protein